MVAALLEFAADIPRTLTVEPRLTDIEFEALSLASDLVSIERTREGEILMHPPTGGFTSGGNADIVGHLHVWWKTRRQGRVYDSNGMFFLPDTSVLSPDAAYILPEKLRGLIRDD